MLIHIKGKVSTDVQFFEDNDLRRMAVYAPMK